MKINVDIYISKVGDKSYKAVAKDAEGTIHATAMGTTQKKAELACRDRLQIKANRQNLENLRR